MYSSRWYSTGTPEERRTIRKNSLKVECRDENRLFYWKQR